MPLLTRCECPACGQGDLFWVAVLRQSGQLRLICDECQAAWSSPSVDRSPPVVAGYTWTAFGPDEAWDYASWEHLDAAGWDRSIFTAGTWAESDKVLPSRDPPPGS